MNIVKSLLLLLAISPVCFATKPEHEAVLKQLRLPHGFKISIFADTVPGARQMALGEDGTVYVGSRESKVYALRDANNDGYAEETYKLAEGLYLPNGVAFRSGALYVAEINRIIRFNEIGKQLANPPVFEVIYDKLPSERHHGWKYLRFGPDGKLYSGVGAPCNVCKVDDERYANLFRLNPDGSEFEIIARGVRNTVGFDWQPGTRHLFFNDNGRDNLGDDVPPDELNKWTGRVQHYGFPYCHAENIPDPEFGALKKCFQTKAPAWEYKAHVAPLGMRFYTGPQFPDDYFQQLFVALHGSWNRSKPQGYEVIMVRFSNREPIGEKPFISGWLTPEGVVLGRPVDVLQTLDGSLLISDDKLGVIYKVEYGR
ncbi:MAG: PQQ-dependent sugar dehydrogenase [Methylomonas sp.]|nr:PQQ-dependent sugar dehydrogenase [Methylomonas sp.]PPD22420.1 MAG: sorbosone dehydrogenase [Methylomonas sp.]PPD26191.1 MAG: sorbosone dehydrogenase [Methylomonas sp.]PPD37908.1 MAG: sorbosone dehydrogenase [Methylomonas sp.]PPD42088.1 MAG: sorbosone dehydrogenase [Methylomonas sp.]